MTEKKHTPLPWQVISMPNDTTGTCYLRGSDGEDIATVWYAPPNYVVPMTDAGANAALIVTAVNAHEALKKALSIMVLDPFIRAFLDKYDPKALEQALKALEVQ